MGSTTCSECGDEIDSLDDLERQDVEEIEPKDDGSFSLYGNKHDLFLCKGCRNPMGVGKRED